MKRDLEIAKDIQAWLLPGAPLQIPGYQIAYATRPANTVAGDYYDVILRPAPTLSDNRVLFVVADVAGKEYSGGYADGDASGQSTDTFQQRLGAAARADHRPEPLRVFQQPGRRPVHDRVFCGARLPASRAY